LKIADNDRMTRAIALIVSVFTVAACNKGAAPSSQKSSVAKAQFDAKWKAATAGGEEPLYIELQKGGGLMGEVRRAVGPARELPMAKEPISGPLPDPVAAGVIRRNLPAVKGCYEVEERAGTVGSGKAIVSLEIQESGSVQDVSVDAPAFVDSKLPACISQHARNWTFPRFTSGPKKFSYPFVFVGG
jgi:hypothetical protein